MPATTAGPIPPQHLSPTVERHDGSCGRNDSSCAMQLSELMIPHHRQPQCGGPGADHDDTAGNTHPPWRRGVCGDVHNDNHLPDSISAALPPLARAQGWHHHHVEREQRLDFLRALRWRFLRDRAIYLLLLVTGLTVFTIGVVGGYQYVPRDLSDDNSIVITPRAPVAPTTLAEGAEFFICISLWGEVPGCTRKRYTSEALTTTTMTSAARYPRSASSSSAFSPSRARASLELSDAVPRLIPAAQAWPMCAGRVRRFRAAQSCAIASIVFATVGVLGGAWRVATALHGSDFLPRCSLSERRRISTESEPQQQRQHHQRLGEDTTHTRARACHPRRHLKLFSFLCCWGAVGLGAIAWATMVDLYVRRTGPDQGSVEHGIALCTNMAMYEGGLKIQAWPYAQQIQQHQIGLVKDRMGSVSPASAAQPNTRNTPVGMRAAVAPYRPSSHIEDPEQGSLLLLTSQRDGVTPHAGTARATLATLHRARPPMGPDLDGVMLLHVNGMRLGAGFRCLAAGWALELLALMILMIG